MPHVSKKRIKKSVAQELADEFITFLATAKSKQDARILAKELLSQTERVMLAKRLAVVLLLARGYSFTQIEDSLGVTRQTVGRLAHAIKAGRFSMTVHYAEVNTRKLHRRAKGRSFVDGVIHILSVGMSIRYGSQRRENFRKLLASL